MKHVCSMQTVIKCSRRLSGGIKSVVEGGNLITIQEIRGGFTEEVPRQEALTRFENSASED